MAKQGKKAAEETIAPEAKRKKGVEEKIAGQDESSSLGLAQVTTPKRNSDFVHGGHCFLTFIETDKEWKVKSQWPKHATAELREGDQVALYQKHYLGDAEILAAQVLAINDYEKNADIGKDIPIKFNFLGKFKSEQDILYKVIEPNDTSLMRLTGYDEYDQPKDNILVPPSAPGEQPAVVATGENKQNITDNGRSANRHELGGHLFFPNEYVTDGAPEGKSKVRHVDFRKVALRVRGYSKHFEEWILKICKDANISDGDTKLPQYFEENEFKEHIKALIQSAIRNPDKANKTLLSVSTITGALYLYPTLVKQYKVSSIVLQSTHWNRRRLNRFCTVQIFYAARHQFEGPVSFPLALYLDKEADNVRPFWTTAIVKRDDDFSNLEKMMLSDSVMKVKRINVGKIGTNKELADAYIGWDELLHSARPPFFDMRCYCCRDQAEEKTNIDNGFVKASLTQKIVVQSLRLKGTDEVVRNAFPSVQPWLDRTEFSDARTLLRQHSTLLFEIAHPKDFFQSSYLS